MGLCIDGFFEGLAIGSQSSFNKVIFIGVALLFNKIIVACNLGILFKITIREMKIYIRYVLLFSIFTPFGIMLSAILYEESELFLRGIFLAISSGSFLYVSTSVIIVEEFALTKYKYSKFALFLLGGISTIFLIIFTENK